MPGSVRILVIGWRMPTAALLALLLLGACGVPERNLLLISLDTTRRDHLPTYGYGRDTAPALDRLARAGVVFERAFAQDTNTNPSHASMFTGLYPHVHGSRANGVLLRPGVTTLAEILARRGFATAAVVAGTPMRSQASGLQRGFQLYDDDIRLVRRGGDEVAARALAWLAQRGKERWFLFVHLYDAHGPYRPDGDHVDLFRADQPALLPVERIPLYQRHYGPGRVVDRDLHAYVARYDAMIRFADDQVGAILAAVDLERTLVVVLADHGETLGERYQKLDHGGQVFDEQIRIPLVMHGPSLAPRRVQAPVETVDLLPTILEILRVPLPGDLAVQGRSLVPLLRDGGAPQDRPVFFTARAVGMRHADRRYQLDERRRIAGVRAGPWKLIRYPGRERDYVELYDLASDPAERENLAGKRPVVRDRYLALLRHWARGASEAVAKPELSPELREELRSLGYLD